MINLGGPSFSIVGIVRFHCMEYSTIYSERRTEMSRKSYGAEFKRKVAMTPIRGDH